MKLFLLVSLVFEAILIIESTVNVSVNTAVPIHTVSDQFLGITLDSSIVTWWQYVYFNDMVTLSRALGPGILRFGGTDADKLYFVHNSTGYNSTSETTKYAISASQLDTIFGFAKQVGWHLIYDLNQLLRNGTDWNSTNAQSLINYAASKGYQLDFELGNEPNLYKQNFNTTLTYQQIVNSYRDLRTLLKNSRYNKSIVIGPSLSQPFISEYQSFLNAGGASVVDVLTFHQYSIDGYGSVVSNYTDPKILNNFKNQVVQMRSLNYSGLLWLSETATDWCACAPLVSTYADGFHWLDKIGVSATYGVNKVLRQSLVGGSFALIWAGHLFTPDYWLIFLHKKLVSTQVYNVTIQPNDGNLRLYSGSSKNTNGVVVYGMNIGNSSYTLDFPQFSNRNVTLYLVKEAYSGNLGSNLSTLNGEILAWAKHQPEAQLKGIVKTLPIVLPEYSQFFIVVGENQTSQCPSGWYKETTVSNKCINFFTNFTLPWFSSNFECSTYGVGSSSLSIENAFENSEIIQQASAAGCSQFSIGLHNNGSNWVWSNGKSSSFTNWNTGYPTNDTTKLCATFNATTGKWSNSDCDASQCYICQKLI